MEAGESLSHNTAPRTPHPWNRWADRPGRYRSGTPSATRGEPAIRQAGPDRAASGQPVKAGVTEVPAVVVWAPVLPTTVVVVVGAAVVVVVVDGTSPMAAR